MIKEKVRKHLVIGSFICGLYVLLSAFGTHGLDGKITPQQLNTYQTGLRYLIIHGMGYNCNRHLIYISQSISSMDIYYAI